MGAFAISKDGTTDRFIVNPTSENSQCRTLNGWAKTLSSLSLLSGLVLEPDRYLSFEVDDLADCFHSFSVSKAMAMRSAFGRPLPPNCFAGCTSFPDSLRSSKSSRLPRYASHGQ